MPLNTRKADCVIRVLFVLGILLSVVPDFLAYNRSDPAKFAFGILNTALDTTLLITAFVWLSVEISKRRTAMERAEAANELKSRFLQIVAHDLRNPLNNIMQLAALLPEQERETRRIISNTVGEMREIIDGLLDAAELESGALKINVVEADLAELISGVMERNRPEVERKKQRLQVSASEPCVGVFDYGRIRQAVDNLVSNAIKFSPFGKTIFVTVRPMDHVMRVEVADEGPGLTAEDKKLLFERFRRLSARPTGGESSSGLGLSNARQLVELHGGRIGAESPVPGTGQGSLFWIELPRSEG